ncbi:hypothetical protein [Actinomadura luteofluorescens]
MDRWLDTSSGRRINLANPTVDSIAVEDIAGALSRICRFGGHTTEFYSVAQHSILVSQIIERLGRSDLRLMALHHDSHEAYLGDIPTPLKRRLDDMGQYSGYAQLVESMDTAIGQAFHLPMPVYVEDKRILKQADRAAFQMEARRLLPRGEDAIRDDPYEFIDDLPACPEPLSPPQAAAKFLTLHQDLI